MRTMMEEVMKFLPSYVDSAVLKAVCVSKTLYYNGRKKISLNLPDILVITGFSVAKRNRFERDL